MTETGMEMYSVEGSSFLISVSVYLDLSSLNREGFLYFTQLIVNEAGSVISISQLAISFQISGKGTKLNGFVRVLFFSFLSLI